MRLLKIDEKARKDIARVKSYAEANIIGREAVEDMFNGTKAAVGDCPSYTCFIDDGFRVVYSIESQPLGLCGHLSISVDSGDDKVPSLPAVEMIMHEFEFYGTIMDCLKVWLEQGVCIGDNKEVTAVNLLQKLERKS